MDDIKKQKKEEEILNQVQDDKEEVVAQGEEIDEAKTGEQEDNVSVRQVQDKLVQQVEEAEQKYKRALADYQNLVRRTADEKREWARFSNKELVLKLLPILDTLMLAEKHTKDQAFRLVVQQFLQVLEQEGIRKIKTIGEAFNPHTMDAITTLDGEEGKVVEEIRAGFTLGDMVLRPAHVAVGKGEK